MGVGVQAQVLTVFGVSGFGFRGSRFLDLGSRICETGFPEIQGSRIKV